MNFNSIEFGLFFVIIIAIYPVVKTNIKIRNIFLLAASYIFYACWDWRYSGLIFSSTIVDYHLCLLMARAGNKHRLFLLCLSLVFNLGVLALFKYFNFFMSSGNEILGIMGLNMSFPYVNLLLPIGISFYTFQTLSYTIDVYRRRMTVEKNFITFATYVAFFPQLVAGPIVRAIDLIPQLNSPTCYDEIEISSGLPLIFGGLFKKIIIADLLATLGVDFIFSNPEAFSTFSLWLGLYGYAIQIYCDFSGYSDIAIGLARVMGFKLCNNFNRPYLSRKPQEFWQRWHISLSSWLRDYLYISLGGNRCGKNATYVANVIKFFSTVIRLL